MSNVASRSPAAVVRSTVLVRQRGDWKLGFEEHWDACMKYLTNRSAITEHAWTQDLSTHLYLCNVLSGTCSRYAMFTCMLLYFFLCCFFFLLCLFLILSCFFYLFGSVLHLKTRVRKRVCLLQGSSTFLMKR